jgi:hypothetical protein
MGNPGNETEDVGACAECAAALSHDQRYCLHCGARQGAPRVDALAELGLTPALAVAPALAAVPPFAPAPGPSIPPYADPPRRTSRVLVAVLAAGALTVGGALGATVHGPAESLAASPPPRIVIQASAATTPAPAAGDAAAATADTAADADAAGEDLPSASADAATGGDAGLGLDAATADAGSADTPIPAGDDTAGSPTPAPAGDDTAGAPTPAPTPASGSPTPAAAPTPALPAIGHVWVIALTGQDRASAFDDPAAAPYLAGTLVPSGTLLTEYRAIGPGQLANGVALLSGQGPNPATEANCPTPSDVAPGTVDAATGLVDGAGCFYASDVRTLPAQLTAAAKTWRAYLGALPNPCAPSPAGLALPGWVPARNAFAAFHGLADPGGAACVPGEFDLAALGADLDAPANVSWIVPSACDSGDPQPCADGAPAGVPALDAFLGRVVPQIQASAAYRRDGLIVITFDVGPPAADGQEAAPVGALLLGPQVRTGARVATAADHYTLLRTLQDLFSLAPTGHAADAGRTPLGSEVWLPATAPTATSVTSPTTTTTRSRHGGRIAALTPVP